MDIGKLRHRITILKRDVILTQNGFEEEKWVELKTVWAAIENLKGREFYAAAQVQAENTVKFVIRYLPDMDPSMQIIFKDKQYNIVAIDNVKYANRFIELRAQEVVSSD